MPEGTYCINHTYGSLYFIQTHSKVQLTIEFADFQLNLQ